MFDLQQRIIKPTLLLDQDRAVNNIRKMVTKTQKAGVKFRPHFKTHQSATVGEWFRQQGVTAITVSSVDMAVYFAAHGWQDITVAIPVNVRQLHIMKVLSEKIRLNVVVESEEVVDRLRSSVPAGQDVWLKIDAGYHRTGLAWDNYESVLAVAKAVFESPGLNLAGLLTHAGHTYVAQGEDDIARIYRETEERLSQLRQILAEHGWPVAISVGDTPACSLVGDFGSVDEVRPGNFVFYDLSQLHLGACREEDIAVAVACPVVAKHPERQEIVIYGGAIHLSKEAIRDRAGRPIFGRVARLTERGWSSVLPGTEVVSLSQEHGIIRTQPSLMDEVEVGDLLAVIPIHSCLTANLFGWYLTTAGEIVDMAHFVGPF